ncbi:MAG TPA: hypothetical protein VKH81_22575 [Candidatus Angelobacter sp.]|nr:hypothetical protein [Candidatus Angelobacter sp.]
MISTASSQIIFTRSSAGATIDFAVTCPYFFPTERIAAGWAFPGRLPLGAGFTGTCHAHGDEAIPTETELREFCNLGYAHNCPRMPKDRCADGVRFAVARDEGSRIILHYVSERDHEPVEYGRLEYDCTEQKWPAPLRNACLQRQAECYVAVYLERRPRKP